MRFLMALAGTALILGCAQAAPSSTASIRPSAAATVLASVTPASAPASESASAAPASGAVERPPDGVLSMGPASSSGWLGTYCWANTCVDAPVPPEKSALPSLSGAGAQLGFALADGSQFVEWSAFYGATSAGDATLLGEGGESDPDAATQSPPLTAVSFAAPPSGDWVVHFRWFGPAGDAAYAWHVIVE